MIWFIISWIVLGIVALGIMVRDIKHTIVMATKEDFGEDVDEEEISITEESGIELSMLETLAINLVAIAMWPVVVPLTMLAWRKEFEKV